VPIVNNSAAAITFCLTLTPTCLALQSEGVLTVSPTELITLQPKGGMAKVEVVLSPKSRIANFTEEVCLNKGCYLWFFINFTFQIIFFK